MLTLEIHWDKLHFNSSSDTVLHFFEINVVFDSIKKKTFQQWWEHFFQN
jgi:hypothetical protein